MQLKSHSSLYEGVQTNKQTNKLTNMFMYEATLVFSRAERIFYVAQ